MEFNHYSVLLNETIENLNIKPDGIYVDGTLGGGGHAYQVASRLSEKGRLIGIDQDADAIAAAGERLKEFGDKITIIRSNYANMKEELHRIGVEKVDGIVLDLGVSSHQLDTPERGFSYHEDAPLDMRMDPSAPLSAYDVVNGYPAEALARIIREYGEERYAMRVANAIVREREKAPLDSTVRLAEIVKRAMPAPARREQQHPARRTFQALRMAVNDEIGELERFLDAILGRLKPGGRVAVISFHSLEDRVVKHRMKAWAQGCICPKHIPVCVCHHAPEALLVTPKPVCPSERELMLNPRAGSAKLRVAEKLDPHARKADEDSGEEAARLRYEAKRAARLARHGREGWERA